MRKRTISICLIALLLMLSCTGVCADEIRPELGLPYEEEYVQIVDSAFTIAFVGDTQIVTRLNPEKLDTIYQWIVDNKESKNIQFVAGLGDITDKNADFEWDSAIAAIQKMDGVVPYSLIRGNHDDPYLFTTQVSYDSYISQLDGMYNGVVLNTYKTITVGTLKYLFLNLDHGPSNEVLAWACKVVEDHPDHNVIVTTHGYIDETGLLLEIGSNPTLAPSVTSGTNDATAIWNKLIKKYANIVMVVCGHMGDAPEGVNFEVEGDNGNKIQHVLINSQHLDRYYEKSGIVSLFHFSADGTQVQVENYATLVGQHYGSGFTFSLNSIGGNALQKPTNYLIPISVGAGAAVVLAVVLLLLFRKKKKA